MSRIPSQCAVCHAWPSQPLCEDCTGRLARPVHRCLGCALRLPEGVSHCGACLTQPLGLDRCHAVADYGFPWAGALAALKFHGQLHWAPPLAHLMRQQAWATPLLDGAELVLPVPLSAPRLRERGYNQAQELLRHFAPGRARHDLLLRLQDTEAQTTLDRARRLRNLRHAFALAPGRNPAVAGRSVLLVDDVMTTGATLAAAAAVLRRAGAREVAAAVFARTPRPGAGPG